MTSLEKLISDIDQDNKVALNIIGSRLLHQRFYADFSQLIAEYKVAAFLDIGAGRGEFVSTLMGGFSFRAQTMSFEPVPAFYKELQASSNFYLEWSAQPEAVDVRNGTARFFIDPTDARRSRFGKRTDSSANLINVSTVDVRDAKANIVPRGHVAMMRLNASGKAAEILERLGAKHLNDFAGVLLGVGLGHEDIDIAKGLTILASVGFVVADFYPSEAWRSGVYREGEVLLMRRDILPKF